MTSYPPPGQQPYQQPGQGYPGGGYAPPPPQKNNAVWWIVGIIAAGVVLCCCAGIAWFGFVANEVRNEVSSATSSYSASPSSRAANAQSVSEGQSITLGDIQVNSGWSLDSITHEPENLRVVNNGGTGASVTVVVYYMQDGQYVDDAYCSVGYVAAGATGSANCIPPIGLSDGDWDELRIDEGF